MSHEAEGSEVLLSVRQRRLDERGITMPYVFLGPVRYVRHQGGRPMQIVWELRAGMPPWLYC